MAKKNPPRKTAKTASKLTEDDIFAMRAEFFKKVTDADMRARILTIAFAYGDQSDDIHATDKMAWYLAQERNRDQIDELALEYFGYMPDDAEEGGPESDDKGSTREE